MNIHEEKPMSAQLFIPISDEILYDHPELIPSKLLPYTVGMECFHWKAEIELADGTVKSVSSLDDSLGGRALGVVKSARQRKGVLTRQRVLAKGQSRRNQEAVRFDGESHSPNQ
jgi:hypothetical protein